MIGTYLKPEAAAALAVLLVVLGAASPASAQQVPDTAYAPGPRTPAYAPGAGPRVVVDAAHLNFHTADGRYRGFADLLRRDGFVVESGDGPFTASALAGTDVLVIANALHEQSRGGWAPLPNRSAFTPAEIEAVEAWVGGGGSLLLIADHMPIAGHNEALASAFGVRFHNGFAFEGAEPRPMITFRRSDGSLRTAGLATASAGPVDSVTTFTGQAFRVDPGVDAVPLLVLREGTTVLLPAVAWQFSDSTPRIPGAHLLQGALVRHGRGRVAVFGEAAMFSAQLAGPNRTPMGMNNPSAGQNWAFVLDVVRWLTEGW